MINEKLINPRSIVVVGGSNDVSKPGGKVLKNLLIGGFKGYLCVVNPKLSEVQGIKAYNNVEDIPDCDLAILAVASKYCLHTVEVLAHQKHVGGFIILSAGFSEENAEGAAIEKEIVKTINEVGGSLIGPNCIGFMNVNYKGVFVAPEPLPRCDFNGIDFISGSGATALFVMETCMSLGLTFNTIASVGNCAQLGVEEMLEYLDDTFVEGHSPKTKLLYMESIKKPAKLLKHARSLISKGCHIAAVKAGSSAAGSRAASSHTGALAGSDTAVEALFRKAGIVRCFGRNDLASVASVFHDKEMKGRNIAIITHAGGPGVMLTDALSNYNVNVPHIDCPELLAQLFPGSSVGNPIDYLVTGTVEQLETIIDYCENKFDFVDGMVVIYGNPKLFDVRPVFDLVNRKIQECKKPIYPVFPSIINSKVETEEFIEKGNVNFPDEVILGNSLGKVLNTHPMSMERPPFTVDVKKIRSVIDSVEDGYIAPQKIQELLDAAGIKRAGEAVVKTADEAAEAAAKLGFPVVMKVVGPVHKSDVGGVTLNVNDEQTARAEFERMIKIKDTYAVLLQNMLSGTELFAGAKFEPKFGHLVLCGLGGIFIEVLKDVQSGLVPLSVPEITGMVNRLKGFKILQGVRGQEGVNIDHFIETVARLSMLVESAPEIVEMDLNPLLGNTKNVTVVDARVKIEHNIRHE
ncbi:MAG: acetate--CoA ligase family protein [Bacteroidales bacterium]|nr:acetate--CoA ligase family protein [Bacteroidales bacterium]